MDVCLAEFTVLKIEFLYEPLGKCDCLYSEKLNCIIDFQMKTTRSIECVLVNTES